MTDPIADMLTRIRNAVIAKHTRVDLPASRIKTDIARILQDEGYIAGFKVVDDTAAKTTAPVKSLRLFLKYGPHGEKVITGVQRISRPGRRVYKGADDIKPVRNGLGLGIVSTSQGLLSDAQARERRVGGELLCEIW